MRSALLLYLFLFPLLSFGQAQQKLLPVKKDRQWGYIDTSGKVIIEPQFEHAESFTGNFAIVKKNRRYAIINRSGKLLTTPDYDEIQILNDTLVAVVTDSLWGVIDHNGKIVLPMECTVIVPVNKRLFLYSSNGKTGAFSSSGKLLVPAQYDTVLLAHKRFLFARNAGKLALYNIQGKQLLPQGNDTIAIHNDSIVMYQRDTLWGCMHVSGVQFLAPQWRDYDMISPQLMRVAGDSAWALYSLTSKLLVCPPRYTDFFPYSEEYVITQTGKLYGLINMSGNEVITPSYHDIAYVSDEMIKMQLNGLWGMASVKGTVLREPSYTYIGDFKDNLARVWVGRKIGAVNIHGQELVKPENDSLWLHSTVIKAFASHNAPARLVTVDDNGYVIDDNTFANLKTLKIGYAYKPAAAPLRRAQQQLDSLMVNDFKWFFDRKKRLWGMANIKTQDTIIRPTFTKVTILWNQGMTLVEKPMKMIRQITLYGIDFQFSHTYGIIENTSGKFKINPNYLELRPSDAHGITTDPYIRCLDESGKRGVISLDGKEDFLPAAYIESFRSGHARVFLNGKITITNENDRSAVAPLDSLIGNLNCRYSYSFPWKVPRNAWFKCEETKYGSWIYVRKYADIGPTPNTYHIAFPYYHNNAIVKRNGKWGVVDSVYKNIVNYQFDYIDHLPNSDNKLFRVERTMAKTGYVDRNGNEVLTPGIDAGMDFREGRAAVKRKGKWGFIDTLGNYVVETKYDEVHSFSEGLAAVKVKNKWGFIDRNGTVIAEPAYQQVGDLHEGMAWVKLKSKCGFIDATGAIVIQPVYKRSSNFSQGRAVVKEGDKWGVIDTKGEWIVKPKYKAITDYSEEGFAIATRRNRSGVLNKQGKINGRCSYEMIRPFSEGYAAARKRKRWGYIDTTGKIVIEVKYNSADKFSNGMAMVRENGRFGYINESGTYVIAPEFSKAQPHSDGLAYARRKKEAGFIDGSGNFAITTKRQSIGGYSNGYALVSDTGRSFTYINTQGKRITRKRFEQARPFVDSMACVRYKGKWGAIDMDGLALVPYKYDEIGRFSEGIAKVRVNAFYGVYNGRGWPLIDPDCDKIAYEGNNLFRVEKGDKIGYLNTKTGKWKWELGR